jgi:hypothetical protein
MKPYRLLIPVFLIVLLSGTAVLTPASAVTDPSRLQVDETPAASLGVLVQRSEIVAIGWIGERVQSHPTGRSIREGRIVNYTQAFHVRKAIKGQPPSSIRLLSTGVDPLPGRESPLNQKYPGPLSEGNYLLFLQKVKGSNLYSVTGLWQGVYPLLDGKTIALESGFRELHQLTPEQVEQTLKRIRP